MFTWILKGKMRSPTERQLARWETDGGNYHDIQLAVLEGGKIYGSRLEFLKADLLKRVSNLIRYLWKRMAKPESIEKPISHASSVEQVKGGAGQPQKGSEKKIAQRTFVALWSST